jgi:hypothetical protein
MVEMDHPSRRKLDTTRILLFIWLGLGIILGLILCYIASQAFRPIATEPQLVGTIDEYPLNSVNLEFINARFFDDTANKEFDTLPLQVLRNENGTVTVFFARSTRQEEAILIPSTCVVEWDTSLEQFLEPCAGSLWTREGKYVAGSAPRDLDRFPARVENGSLYIDLKLEKGAAHP